MARESAFSTPHNANFVTVLALVLLWQALETPSFLGDAKIQSPQEVGLCVRRVKLALSLRVCDHTQQLFLKGLLDIFVYFRTVSRHTVLLVSVKDRCCTCLMLVSGTSLTLFSIFSLSCFVIFRLPPLCTKKSHVHVTLFQACGRLLNTGVWPSQSSVDGAERLATGHVDTKQLHVGNRPR